jgi:hypothetical protein
MWFEQQRMLFCPRIIQRIFILPRQLTSAVTYGKRSNLQRTFKAQKNIACLSGSATYGRNYKLSVPIYCGTLPRLNTKVIGVLTCYCNLWLLADLCLALC